jgi:ActR/RegA family two-component response regulator
LVNVSKEEQYSEELEDSFGEVANIICGAATATFEEQYPKNFRFIRTEQEVVTPGKVVVESEAPIPDGSYYVMTATMQLESRALGSLDFILPAVPFGLAVEEVKEPTVSEAKETSESTGAAIQERSEDEGAVEPVQPERDLGKQKILVDELLNKGMVKMGEEVSALLGGNLQVLSTENLAISKEGFLEQAGGKQIMTRLNIRGSEHGDEAFLFVDLKTAVYLGGALIMLPDSELEEAARNEDFGDDASDAYGEVTNIIAGLYTTIFEEKYHTKLGFVKSSMEKVVPAKVDPSSDEVLPNQAYYLSIGQLQYNGKDLGRVQMVIPASVLELEDLFRPADALAEDVKTNSDQPQKAVTGKAALSSGVDSVRSQETSPESTDVLIFADDDNEGSRIATALQQMGYVPRLLHFKDSVNSVLTSRIQMIFLVMQEVSEQGFGVAIKISSAGLSVPLVVAGPAWTRTLVLKAVKYGARDILITPSSPGDIREKMEVNLVKRAA